jgi:type I restriction enzyme S subunit
MMIPSNTTSSIPKTFAVRFKDLFRWDPASFHRISWSWPSEVLVLLGNLLSFRRDKVDRKQYDFAALQPITIHFNGSIDKREVKGNREYSMDLFFARPGDLVVAKIDLKNGAVGIVPDDWSNVVVTNHFAVYKLDRSRIEPFYLHRLIQTSFFKSHLWRNKVGAEGRKEVKLDFFEAHRIPLPPLSIQRSIVSAWERAKGEIASIRRRIVELEEKIEVDFLADLGLRKPKRAILPKVFGIRWKDLERWSVMFNQMASVSIDIAAGKYPVTALSEVAAVSYGIQKCPGNRPGQHARPYLRVANVQQGELDLSEVKRINVPDADMPSLRLKPEDLLVCEGNSADLVGRPAIWRGEIPDCVHQNHILKVRVDNEKALPEYVLEFMQTGSARAHFRSRAKFTTNLASINSNDLRALQLVFPPLSVQRDLVNKVTAQRRRIAALKAEANEKAQQARADVEAMILGIKPVPKGH